MSASSNDQVSSIMASLHDGANLEQYQAALRGLMTVVSLEIGSKFGIAIADQHHGGGPQDIAPGPCPRDPVLDLAHYALCLREPMQPSR